MCWVPVEVYFYPFLAISNVSQSNTVLQNGITSYHNVRIPHRQSELIFPWRQNILSANGKREYGLRHQWTRFCCIISLWSWVIANGRGGFWWRHGSVGQWDRREMRLRGRFKVFLDLECESKRLCNSSFFVYSWFYLAFFSLLFFNNVLRYPLYVLLSASPFSLSYA